MGKNYFFIFCFLLLSCNSSNIEDQVFPLHDEFTLETIDSVDVDTDSFTVVDTAILKIQKDSIRKVYEEDLSLEIKEIEEEKEDPISEECKFFLEDYAAAISSYTIILEKIDANQDNINLIIARSSQEEEMYSYSSDPQMFRCLQNPAFKKQVEILNNKRDKLISQ